MNNVVSQTRFPMPSNIDDLDAGKWRVLCESVFPNAKTAESIVLALEYCRARNLDPFKRPVNIVPMYNKSLKRDVETVWPGINEVQVTASRTGKYAGMDSPQWGGDITKRFISTIPNYKNEDGNWEKDKKIEIDVTFPEWCSVTVYRMVDGQKCAFTEPVYWQEAYARVGKSDVPNHMWAKRPRGQLLKVAKAFSLRAAFPEEGEYTAEEMEGREIEHGGVVIDNDNKQAKPLFKNSSLRNKWCESVIEQMQNAPDKEEVLHILNAHKERCDELIANGHDHDVQAVESIRVNADIVLKRFKSLPKEGSDADIALLKGMPLDASSNDSYDYDIGKEPEWVTDDPLPPEPQIVPSFIGKGNFKRT